MPMLYLMGSKTASEDVVLYRNREAMQDLVCVDSGLEHTVGFMCVKSGD